LAGRVTASITRRLSSVANERSEWLGEGRQRSRSFGERQRVLASRLPSGARLRPQALLFQFEPKKFLLLVGEVVRDEFAVFGTIWVQFEKQPLSDRFHRLPMRRIDDVRVDVEGRRNARVAELLLRDLHGHVQIVQQRRMNVAELVPRRSSQARRLRRRLQYGSAVAWIPATGPTSVAEHEIRRRLKLPFEDGFPHGERAEFQDDAR